MRFRLDSLDATGLELAFEDGRQVVRLGAVRGLRGAAEQVGPQLDVTDAAIAHGELAALQLAFGQVTIGTDGPIVLGELAGSLRTSVHPEGAGMADPEHAFACELAARTAEAQRLTIGVGEVQISGQVELSGVRLRLDGDDGVVLADRAVLTELAVTLPGVRAAVTRVEGTGVVVAWGADGFRLEAAHLELARAEAEATLSPGAASGAGEPRAPVAALDPELTEGLLALLDGLDGEVNVDLGLDLTVPVIGRRRATHKFRIPIERGAVDYMRLEKDLSTLENALLDFAMRDGGLVLEMGIPFVPTRGLGKPILRWDLGTDDLALARRDRIRLAMLPRFRPAGDPGADPRASPIQLRRLAARELDARLKLALATPPSRVPVRQVGGLTVTGTVSHDPEAAPRAGKLAVQISDVEIGALELPVAATTVGFADLRLARLGDTVIETSDLQPRAARAVIEGLALSQLRVAPLAPS
jgi:hypothetical protein